MKHNKLFMSIVIINCVALVTALLLSNAKPNLFIGAGANNQSYMMEFSKSKNQLFYTTGDTAHDGNAFPLTNLGNKKQFKFYQMKASSLSWQVLADNGYFYNVDPIYGIRNISLTFLTNNASYEISYSKDNSFDLVEKLTTSSDGSAQIFTFDGFQPSYFKISNTSGSDLDISSLIIDFSCLNNYPTLTLTNENEDMGSVSGGGIMSAGKETTISASPNAGYKFVGWYSGASLISTNNPYTFTMPYNDVNYTARFTFESYNLDVTSEDEEKGSVSNSSGSYDYLAKVTIEAIEKEGYTFKGWYDSNDNFISISNPYSFEMPSSNLSYVAKFMSEEEKEQWNKDHGLIPVFNDNKSTVTYGLYPQTYVSNASLEAALNGLDENAQDSNGYYFYDNEYYVKFTAKPCFSSYPFSDGTTPIVEGNEYWFKCEPITWYALRTHKLTSRTDYELFSSVLLDCQIYDKSSNNYEASYIRDWLNDDFYNSAFCLDNSFIQTIEVDNSASSTGSPSNPYASDNTNDNVYLYSYKELTSTYYFSTEDSKRLSTVTDFTKASGAYYDSDTQIGYYWTRSPYPTEEDDVWRVNGKGEIGNDNRTSVFDDDICVRPAITITISNK